MPAGIFLDTCSINALSSLDESNFGRLRNLLEETNSGLYTSHIQGDERYTKNPSDFRQIQEKAYQKFKKHGIKIHWEEPTKGAVDGVSRDDYCRSMGDSISGVYDQLREEIEKCMKEKRRDEKELVSEEARVLKRVLNIARDCLIAITSTDYGYFITSDKCLYQSFTRILQKSEAKDIFEKIPICRYVKPDAEKILDLLFSILKSSSSLA
ncbi:hypothetical protein MUP01_00270 [Candidatus Bathyarchaeota archaeon]|nr:hypothetical protein [Candidatus Bathyarchaeota archaeon]